MNSLTKLYRTKRGVFWGQVVIHIIFVLACLSVILPLLLMLMVSFTDEISVLQYGYSFWPKKFSLEAYRFVFENDILRAYGVTIAVTAVGTLLSLTISSMCAFAMFQPTVRYRNVIAKFLYFPTLFNAGLIPWYVNIAHTLKLSNNFWVLVLPLLVSAYNIFLIRNYFKSIPYSLVESATIDGANQFTIFFRVMLPLSVPIMATVGLFIALGYWNDWYLANWFINEESLYPLQYYLYRIQNIFSASASGGYVTAPVQTGMVAGMFVTIGPIILVYPFVQRYFIKGIMVGAVKG